MIRARSPAMTSLTSACDLLTLTISDPNVPTCCIDWGAISSSGSQEHVTHVVPRAQRTPLRYHLLEH
jgi:hypothetical protein